MLSKTTRGIVLAAVLTGIVVFVRVGRDDASHETSSQNPPPISKSVPHEANVSTSVLRSTRSVTEASRVTQAPLRLEVRAPSDVRVGEVFQARVDIQATIPVRDLIFSIAYEKSRLSLVGRSEGAFVRQPGVRGEFGVDEPSDGNIEVMFRAVDGSVATGFGSLAELEFEAIRPGTSAIELTNVKSIDAGGEVNADVFVAHERVTIH
jgi:hypothetical protein